MDRTGKTKRASNGLGKKPKLGGGEKDSWGGTGINLRGKFKKKKSLLRA